jgi:hypothetical protein
MYETSLRSSDVARMMNRGIAEPDSGGGATACYVALDAGSGVRTSSWTIGQTALYPNGS